MPVAIVVGGQFGSEGKGKIALELSRRAPKKRILLVRVGGSNSGHTGYDKGGKRYALRQLPAGCIDRNVEVVFPAGSYIDVPVLLEEIEALNYPKDKIYINKYARIITAEHKRWEVEASLKDSIGSTSSGVGAAVLAAIARGASNFPLDSIDAEHCDELSRYVCDTTDILRTANDANARVIIEGTQGFGLSLLDGGYWPKATSRSTTAAAALSEAGLSPVDVDEIYLVLRSFPIRVAGDSGPLYGETKWEKIAQEAGLNKDIREYTTVTNNLRRVGVFDPELVRRAISVNAPTRIVMNHLDYVGKIADLQDPQSRLSKFVSKVELDIGRRIDIFGFSGYEVFDARELKV